MATWPHIISLLHTEVTHHHQSQYCSHTTIQNIHSSYTPSGLHQLAKYNFSSNHPACHENNIINVYQGYCIGTIIRHLSFSSPLSSFLLLLLSSLSFFLSFLHHLRIIFFPFCSFHFLMIRHYPAHYLCCFSFGYLSLFALFHVDAARAGAPYGMMRCAMPALCYFARADFYAAAACRCAYHDSLSC